MGIFNYFKQSFFGQSVESVDSAFDQAMHSVNVVTQKTALQQSPVYACVGLIARAMASMPILVNDVDREGFKTPKRNGNLWYLLNVAPNPFQDSFSFREVMHSNLQLHGVAFAKKYYDQNGVLRALVPLIPSYVRVYFSPDGREILYDIVDEANGIQETALTRREVFHLRGQYSDLINPISPIKYHSRTISSEMSLADHQDQSFGPNMVRAGGVIKSPKNLDPKTVQNIEKRFNERKAGKANWFKTVVLDSGMDWSSFSVTNTDSQFIESRRYSVEDICRIFGVPPVMIQQVEGSSYNTAEQSYLTFVNFTLRPLAQRFEMAILDQLVPDRDKTKTDLDHEFWELARGDMKSTSEYLRSLVQGGIMTPNETRARLSMPRSSDPSADKLYLQQSYSSLDRLDEIQSGKAGVAGGENEEEV